LEYWQNPTPYLFAQSQAPTYSSLSVTGEDDHPGKPPTGVSYIRATMDFDHHDSDSYNMPLSSYHSTIPDGEEEASVGEEDGEEGEHVLWRKLAALQCLKLTPKRTLSEAKLRFQAIMQGMNQKVEVQMREFFDFLKRPTQRRDASLMQCTLIICMTADIFAAHRTIHYRLDPSMLHMAMDGLLRSFSCAPSSPSPLSCDVSNTALPRLTANAVVLQFLFTLVINVGDHYPRLISRLRSSPLNSISKFFLSATKADTPCRDVLHLPTSDGTARVASIHYCNANTL
jgi:hypothetical protein